MAMVHATHRKLLLVGAGLLLVAVAGCAFTPEHGYLVTGVAAIGTEPGLLSGEKAERRVADEGAELVGWWTGFKGIEHLIEDSAGRELVWWEKLLVWALPIAINMRRAIGNVWER